MPTSKEFIDFVLERLDFAVSENLGAIFEFSTRKLFGEYCVYARKMSESERKVLFLVCDEQVFVRKFAVLGDLVRENEAAFELGFAYEGAKEGYILDVENAEILARVVDLVYPFLQSPKPRKRKKAKAKI